MVRVCFHVHVFVFVFVCIFVDVHVHLPVQKKNFRNKHIVYRGLVGGANESEQFHLLLYKNAERFLMA
jgi:hypothetical protein